MSRSSAKVKLAQRAYVPLSHLRERVRGESNGHGEFYFLVAIATTVSELAIVTARAPWPERFFRGKMYVARLFDLSVCDATLFCKEA